MNTPDNLSTLPCDRCGKHHELGECVQFVNRADSRPASVTIEQITSNVTDAERADKLQAFKDFVHRRLDEMGIPTHPDGPHSKEGCRVGDRLDIVQNSLAPAAADRDGLVARLQAQLWLNHIMGKELDETVRKLREIENIIKGVK